MRTALFWAITQRVVVILLRRFETTYWVTVQGSRIQEEFKLLGFFQPSWILLGFLTLEDVTDILSQNVGNK